MRSSATRCITVSTSNTACGTIVAPLMRHARMPGLQAERVEERVDDRGSGRRARRPTTVDHASYAATLAPCVSIAPFGRPVVPDVKRMSETVSPVSAASRRCDLGARRRRRRRARNVVPATRAGGRARRAARRSCSSDGDRVAAREQRRRSSVSRKSVTVKSSFACARSRMYAASAPLNRVLSGTTTPPARVDAERGDAPTR